MHKLGYNLTELYFGSTYFTAMRQEAHREMNQMNRFASKRSIKCMFALKMILIIKNVFYEICRGCNTKVPYR